MHISSRTAGKLKKKVQWRKNAPHICFAVKKLREKEFPVFLTCDKKERSMKASAFFVIQFGVKIQ